MAFVDNHFLSVTYWYFLFSLVRHKVLNRCKTHYHPNLFHLRFFLYVENLIFFFFLRGPTQFKISFLFILRLLLNFEFVLRFLLWSHVLPHVGLDSAKRLVIWSIGWNNLLEMDIADRATTWLIAQQLRVHWGAEAKQLKSNTSILR